MKIIFECECNKCYHDTTIYCQMPDETLSNTACQNCGKTINFQDHERLLQIVRKIYDDLICLENVGVRGISFIPDKKDYEAYACRFE